MHSIIKFMMHIFIYNSLVHSIIIFIKKGNKKKEQDEMANGGAGKKIIKLSEKFYRTCGSLSWSQEISFFFFCSSIKKRRGRGGVKKENTQTHHNSRLS